MTEQSHRDEMNAAIKAQRERQGAAPPAEQRPETPPQPRRKNLLNRLLGK